MEEAEEILNERKTISRIIKKHIYDCYLNSWITEAELLSVLYPFSFVQEQAEQYLRSLPKPEDTTLPVVELSDGVLKKKAPPDPIDFYVMRHFLQYIQQVSVIKKTTTDTTLIEWRTGIHGESGIGFRLTSLLRTESDTAQANASADVYINQEIPAYRYHAMLDDRTCEKCKALDGKIFKMSDKQPGVNFPRIHPRCRCYIEPVML